MSDHHPAALNAPLRLCLSTALLVALGACGERAAAPPAVTPTPELAEPAEPPSRDLTPPTFEGLERVALTGLEYYELSWPPADDDVSSPEAIRYHVFHIVEPYVALTDDATPILISEPGATRVSVAHDAPPGRFYVRAADEAGNLSRAAEGTPQRAERPWVHAASGNPIADLRDCRPLAEGELLCVGQDGFAARWADGAWRLIETGTTAAFRIAAGFGRVWLYSEVGHLVALEGDDAEIVDVRFRGGRPTLPFRQFTEDGLGLRYWIDAEGVVWVGAERAFRRMERPLALPSAGACTRLRALAFTEQASFALCEDGAAYSASEARGGRLWQSLTSRADFPLPSGLRGALATSDTEGLLYDDTGVRRVGVGGWQPLLLTEYPPSVHPMDRPTEGPMPDRMGHLIVADDAWFVVSDLGLLRYADETWSVLPDTEGALFGAAPEGTPSSSGAWSLVYEGGAVARWRRGRKSWRVRPEPSGFTWAGFDDQGAVLAQNGEGWWRWSSAGWDAVRRAALPGTLSALRTAGGLWLAAGEREGAQALWTSTGGAWARGELRRLAPAPVPPTAEPASEAVGANDAPPEPTPPPSLMASADAEAPALGQIVDMDVADDGRAIAVSGDQVWWRLGDNWVLLQEREEAITGVALDSGETYLLLEGGAVTRCWRDRCGGDGDEAVSESTWAPSSYVASWRTGAGLVTLLDDGSTLLFAPAAEPDGADALIAPWRELPAGSWVEDTEAMSAPVLEGTRAAVGSADAQIVWSDDGAIYASQGARWILQAERDDVLLLAAEREGWTLFTAAGALRLGEVSDAIREAREGTP